MIEQNSSDENDGMYIAMINDGADTEEWEVNVRMNEQRVTFKIDTGAQCNVISKETYDKVSRQPLTNSRAKLTAFGRVSNLKYESVRIAGVQVSYTSVMTFA